MLTNRDLIELTALRRDLHRHPEISGEEAQTAATIVRALTPMNPTRVITGLGGHGVAAIFDSGVDGPTVLFRAELDALPIPEISQNDWVSQVAGKGHLCGHDGHMTMLLGLGRLIGRNPIANGRGARAVVADPAFQQIAPDWAFAIHNEPGRPFGHVSTRTGLINCASQGVAILFTGKTAHAAEPEMGVSPAPAIATLIPALGALGTGGALDAAFKLVTVTHVHIGEPTFGIVPAHGQIFATLRAADDTAMDGMMQAARALAEKAAIDHGLAVSLEDHDVFAASVNDVDATNVAQSAMDAIGIPHSEAGLPMRASEDFGVFGWDAKAAMLCLGPGKYYATLHNPDYDFPDDLIPVGVSIFDRIARDLLGSASQ